MTSEKASEKTWHITAERSGGDKDEYFIQAATLHDAYRDFLDMVYPRSLEAVMIAEV